MQEPQEDEVEDDHPLQCIGLQEAPLILEIVKEKELMIRGAEGGIRDPTNKIRILQKRKKLMRKSREKLRRTKYCSLGP